MAIGNVMDRLSKRPSAIPVRSVELLVAQPIYRGTQRRRKRFDRLSIFISRGIVVWVEFSDWVSRISVFTHNMLQITDKRWDIQERRK
jgi:hypothetical protein